MKTLNLFEGLYPRNKQGLLFSLIYTSIGSVLAFSYWRQGKAKERQDFIDMYRGSGHYKHPWVKNPSAVPELVKKTDYPKLVEVPKNNRLL